MNKNLYKTIFSKTRGEMIVVAENVSAEGQQNNPSTGRVKIGTEITSVKSLGLSVLSFSLMLVTGAAMFSTAIDANVVADQNAAGNQRPTVIQSANGTTQVNIQTPTQSGVSMNHYQQFDVNQQGVILNNSRQNTNTQLGGYIQANPWLLGGEAKVIVNQINSQNPSHLNGYVEVGGRKADVIIANQAGINVDGGGFINAGGITLSTGNPLLQNGQVTGFQIRDGVINITGQGLDASTADYTQLLSRVASINAGIWAKDLKVVTGQNDVDESQQISAIRSSASSTGTAPQLAIDTGSLGGMYAGKISLISTEKGIGINNVGQVFSSAGNIQISADGQLNNSGSVVAQDKANPNQATLDIQAQALNNSGSLSSLAQQNIKTENLNNSGLITTSTELNIRNQNQVLNQGELNAGRIDLETTSLKNQKGQIIQTGLQDLAIAANTLSNTQNGLIGYSEVDMSTSTGSGIGQPGGTGTGGSSAPSTATGGGSTSSANSSISASFAQGKIKANSIDNEAGKITANGGVDVTTQQALNNRATLNLNNLTATGDQLSNQGTLSATTLQTKVSNVDNRLGKIYSQNATIEAKQLINQSGVIQGQDRLNLNVEDQLNNRAGQIIAINAIDITDGNQNSLTIDNTQAGKILSVGDIRLQSKKLLHAEQSELAANQNIALKQTDALTVDAKIQAGQDLTIDNQSDVVNNSALEAGRSLKLSAQNIKNSPQGQIQANQQVQLLARDKIENTGLVNSQGLTLLDAKNEIQNMGTGQIYGDHVALQTKHLLNAEQQTSEGVKAGTIAARQRLDIASEKIENREQALISSENQLVVGGQLNQDYLAEGSAQSLDNASARIQSGGDMYLGVDTLSNRNLHFSSSVKEIPGTRKQVTAYQGRGSSEILDESHITRRGGHETIYLDGKEYEDYTRYNYTEHETKNYVDSSAPAEIISGGTLSINGQNLTNDKSQILAAKGINILGSGVNNIDAEGEHRIIKEGTSRYHYVGWNSLGTSKRSKWNSSRAYNPADIVTPIKLDVVKYDGAYQGGVNSTQIESVVRENIEDKTSTEIWSITPDLSLPNQSLFSINKDNNNQPLIETSDAFTNYKKWLGSDYMLQMLNTDSQNIYKRLGDGYYEQKLVNDQIAKLTGQVYLDGYSNYEDQFKSLMDSGISAAKDFNLRVGVALSEAQIARLTSGIVWLVTETVTLVDGEKVQVLVPKVYAVVQAGDLNGQGTLIAADNVNLKLSSDLTNQGTIAGRQLVNLEAKNINNIGGLVQGREVFAIAQTDINNVGGQIQANKTLALDAGRDINNTTIMIKTENKSGLSEFSAENIGRVAGLYVTDEDGQLIAQAKNDINLTASDIQSQSSVTINAGQDLTLSTVNVNRRDLSSGGENNQILNASSRDVGTQIQAKGDIQLQSGANTQIKAGTLNSEIGNVVVNAGKDVLIENGRDERSSQLAAQEKGGFSKTNKKIQSSTSRSIATDIQSGGSIVINSQTGDIQATHLTADAKDSIQITANQGNVKLLSDLDAEMMSKTSEKTNAVQFKNRQSGYIDEEVAQTQLKAGKNVDINAGKNIELQANDIQAKDNIYIGNTQFERQADGSLTSKDGNALPENVSLTTLETNDQQWDETQKGYRGIAKDLMKVTAIGLAGIEGLAPGLKAPKITIGESSSTRTEQRTQTGTDLSANNVYVGSAGKTTLTSSNIDAQNTVLAGQKVTLDAAEEQQKTVSSSSKETVQGLGAKLNKDSIRVGGFVLEDTEHETTTTATTHKAGNINTNNLTIQGTEGVDILGQNITASGDTVIDHGRGNLNIGGYENKTTATEKTHTETVSTEVGIRNAYVDAALAVSAVADATKALSKAKDDYSQAQRDYAAGKITKDALDDSKANIVLATANVTSAQIAVGAAMATAAASSATYGFTIGANGERIETTSTTNIEQSQWQGSNLDVNNLKLKAEGQDVNIQGSRVNATGTTVFDGTKDLNVTAGVERTKQDSSSKTNSQSLSYTYGGGGSASIGKQTSQSQSESLTHVNSEVTLNRTEGAIDQLNIKGGTVSIADRGNLQVNGIHVESLQDTASSSNSSKGGSIGGGYGGGSKNISASYNQGKGNSDSAWVNETSKLLIGNAQNDADLDAMGVKKVTNIGGVIANATKNTDGTLTDHGKLNYSGELELKDIEDHNYNSSSGFNVSTTIGIPQKGTQESSTAPKGSTTIGLNSNGQETEQLTKATMGQGTVKNATDSTNRDINNTQEITRDQTTGMLDGSVTIDHRLLTEAGRKEIIQQQKDLPENFRQSAENLAQALPDGEYKDKVLQTLNNIQAKLYNLPSEYKEAGVVGDKVASELLKRGIEPAEVEALFSKLDFFYAAKEFSEIQSQLDILAKSGLDLETIFQQSKIGISEEETIYAKGTDFEIKVTTQTTVGMTILSNIADLGNNIKQISEDTGVDLGTVQLAVGLMISGPVRLVIETGKSVALDSLVGGEVAQGFDALATSLTASAHVTNSNTINNWTNSEKVKEIENSTSENKLDELKFANEIEKNKQGAEYLINAVAGVVGGIAVGKSNTTKIDGKDVNVSTAGIGKDPVKELEVGSYKDLKSRAQVGDGLEHDHIPSFAALKKAEENRLGRKLTESEANNLYNDATTIEISRETHKAGRTYGGKNTSEQIANDANNLCTAQKCDIDILRQNLLDRGHSKKAVDDAILKLTERNKDKGIY